jgi:hypothetical protein
MTAAASIAGERFGRLTAIERVESDRRGQARWKCLCDCGTFSYPLATSLLQGKARSCGCLQKEIVGKLRAKDITGQRFGRLVVLHRMEERRNGKVVWCCRCDCGRTVGVTSGALAQTRSCGCLRREQVAERNYRHGGAIRNNSSPLYVCWYDIKTRCFNQKSRAFRNYGERGISMAPEWIEDFQAFQTYISDTLGPRPKDYSIDRIENNEGYYPGNLKWSTSSEQKHNSRQSRLNKAVDAMLLEGITRPHAGKRGVVAKQS